MLKTILGLFSGTTWIKVGLLIALVSASGLTMRWGVNEYLDMRDKLTVAMGTIDELKQTVVETKAEFTKATAVMQADLTAMRDVVAHSTATAKDLANDLTSLRKVADNAPASCTLPPVLSAAFEQLRGRQSPNRAHSPPAGDAFAPSGALQVQPAPR